MTANNLMMNFNKSATYYKNMTDGKFAVAKQTFVPSSPATFGASLKSCAGRTLYMTFIAEENQATNAVQEVDFTVTPFKEASYLLTTTNAVFVSMSVAFTLTSSLLF
jgi:hypothetical protein